MSLSEYYLPEVVCHFKFIFGVSHVTLDLRICVIDDGQEHVDQDEEHKEHKQHEEDWSQNSVGFFQLVEVKISQDDTEQGEADKIMQIIILLFIGCPE